MKFPFPSGMQAPDSQPAMLAVSQDDIEAAVTRQLYAGLRLPLLVTLIACLLDAVLLWGNAAGSMLLVLVATLLITTGAGLWLHHAYRTDTPDDARHPVWRLSFIALQSLLGAGLAVSTLWLTPLVPPLQQALAFGLLTVATLVSAANNAVCPRAFLMPILTSVVPITMGMLREHDPYLQQWGVFGLLLLTALLLGGWLVHRVSRRNLASMEQNRALLAHQEHSRRMSDALNQELAREIFERQSIEQELLAAKWQLEARVSERTRELTASEQARRKEEAQRLYLARHDQLTGLANRSLLMERIHLCATHIGEKHDGSCMAVLVVDLDRFKWLNESLGHDVADDVLRWTARRLLECVYSNNTVARLSVDEFAILIEDASSQTDLESLAGAILSHLRQPLLVNGHELRLSASLGIAFYPDHTTDERELISRANMAMRHIKQLGGNNMAFYSDALQASNHERLILESQLDKALDGNQLEVYYQPRLSLSGDRVQGAEALVRWHHPELGMVSPASFIGLAEETGQINAIGAFVLRQACTQVMNWLEAGYPPLCVSVNVSTHQLRQGDFVDQVSQVLQDTGLPPHLLELELTESQLSVNVEVLRSLFTRLHALGVRLAIDDFGTGYSSLGYLKHLPVDVLKIDRTFIRELDGTPDCGDAAITRAIIAMAHSLGLEVVAEGVEEKAQMEFLRANGCDEIQGFLISRPVPPADFKRLLDNLG